ncbi:MAG: alpha/beta hydrolase [Candidatus Micrarchaeaceae archaeon]
MRYEDFSEEEYKTSYGNIFYRHNNASGRCLVLLHGLGADSRVWKRFIEYLPENMHVFALDLLGHGNSEKPRINYTVEMQANAIREFVKANCDHAVVFGHSYGGWIAAYYAYKGFECEGIVLEDAAGLESNFYDLKTSNRYENYKASLLKAVLMQNNNERYVIESIIDNSGKCVLTRQMLDSINKPVLIIWGTNDNVIDVKYAYEFNKFVRNSKLILVNGAKHDAHYTNAEEVANALIDFGKRLQA